MKEYGTSVLQNKGELTDRDVSKLSEFIKDNYMVMYEERQKYSENVSITVRMIYCSVYISSY